MKSPRKIAIAFAIISYAFLCVRGWLGVSYGTVPNPDGVHYAAVFARSPILFPFWHKYEVLVPSVNDLNSHIVYQDAWFYREFEIEWQNPKKLLIFFNGHSTPRVVQSNVDDVEIEEMS